ncbi:MAG: beta-ketoacyl-[acyl-carrier-protein] synthase family protein [Desulfovibrionales bacterium]|nr:beta-ketoacyl-[acyl-carrier-protein] synthase family protein [Desulfovibrionales bacterium]
MRQRVVITGTGYTTSLGCTPESIEHTVRHDTPAFAASTHLDGCMECPVVGFDLTTTTGRWKHKKYLPRGAQFALASALRAVDDSRIPQNLLEDAGLFIGTGPNFDMGSDFPNITDGNMDTQSLAALWMLRYLPNTAASAISQFLHIHGENATIGTACSASTQAIGEAYRKIKDGYLTTALAGGGDSRISHGGLLAYKKAQALWDKGGNPQNACRPFNNDRSGFVVGEGGGMFVLESLEQAEDRGATILAEVLGFGVTMDAHTMTAPHPDALYAEKAVRTALAEADMPPDAINLISAHGTSTHLNDQAEADMLARVFYTKDATATPLTVAIKSWVGHCTAASGAVELSVLLALRQRGILPPVRNLRNPCSQHVQFVQNRMPCSGQFLLLESFGFGGQNSALVLKFCC